MRTYHFVSLLVVTATLAFVAGLKVGEGRVTPSEAIPAAAGSDDAVCACELPAGMEQTAEPPQIPPVEGLTTLIAFGGDETDECRQMRQMIVELEPRLEGRVGVLILDTTVYPQQAAQFRLRMVPTQIFLNADGEEVSRHEGVLSAEELLAKLRAAGAEIE